MQLVLVVSLVLHVLSGVYWAGCSFVMALNGAAGIERVMKSQAHAAIVAAVTGVFLWNLAHRGGFGPSEILLAFGVMAAIVAGFVQWTMAMPAVAQLRAAEGSGAQPRAEAAKAMRISALLLALTVACMAAARYAG